MMGKPHTHWRKNIHVDQNLESYDIQLTRKWARQIDDAAAKSAVLSNLVADFVMSMRSTAITSKLPHVVVSQFEHFVSRFVADSGPAPVGRLATQITERLAKSSNLSPECQEQIRVECLLIAAKCDAKQITPLFTIDEVWQDYLKDKGYQLALWESQRAGMVNIYNAYEIFLQRCMAVAIKQRRYVIRKKFPADFIREFGQSVYDDCWNNERVQSLRLTRKSIVHEGGRETEQLKRVGHNIDIENGELQVMPHDLKAAIKLVEQCANKLVAAAVVHNSFLSKKRRKGS